MRYSSIFLTLKDRFSRTAIVMLLGLTVTLLNTSCNSTSQGNSNELLGNVTNSSVKKLKNSEQKLSSLNIAMSPSQSSEEQRQKRQLLADYLQEQLGLSVNIEIPQDYETAIDLIAEGKVQMAYLGPFSYVKARQRNFQLEPLVAYIDKRTGRPWYTSAIVADTQSGIKTIADLKGKRVGFVNQSSTSGYLVPVAHLKSHNIDPEQDFAELKYTGSHNKNAVALESGQVDAIGINKPTYLKAQKSGQLPLEKYQVIWESDPIPNAPIVISRKLPAQVKSNLQKALINAPQDLAALSGAKSDGYTLVRDEDYEPIRELQKILEIDTAE
ncbi:MAG: phosphate/phosphite/phosphonate ABC transporter substrate-binding protein [Xenococcaceae cyanobacterium MO_188.B32]|nr:phosphate/phosphite/phosphonate ABC transporter substrate-binding protein [Xenococcaceae cyanobacterium MO_188.B32]